jgi:16S rRNA (cytosine1402-N4)-methyltransferase
MQIDDPARGFTFKVDGPLDMRMNPAKHPSAAELLASLKSERLAQILAENADEPYAVPLAQAIHQAQRRSPLTTTRSLADLVRNTAARLIRSSSEDPENSVRRVFQALRIAVNDEFGALDTFLKRLPECLKPGGRVAILSFHSGEDRRVKHAFKEGLQLGLYDSISPDVIRPSMEEQRANPRSTSAKLRSAVRARTDGD